MPENDGGLCSTTSFTHLPLPVPSQCQQANRLSPPPKTLKTMNFSNIACIAYISIK
jgi:hypothetical protein